MPSHQKKEKKLGTALRVDQQSDKSEYSPWKS
jgi:hypothetical protein